MTRRDPSHPPDGPDPVPLHDIVRELSPHLTVVYARTQLLQRFIRQGRIKEAYDCLQALAAIERSAGEMREYLHSLYALSRQRREEGE